MQTKEGQFIHGKVERLPFAKKIKKFTRKHQSYLQVQVSGNLHGVGRYDHFITELHTVIGEIIDSEPTLVVVPMILTPIKHSLFCTIHQL